jgi:hypothetical protein
MEEYDATRGQARQSGTRYAFAAFSEPELRPQRDETCASIDVGRQGRLIKGAELFFGAYFKSEWCAQHE